MADYLIMAAAILMAGFFSGSETGLYCLDRLRLRLRAEKGRRSARLIHAMLGRPTQTISVLLLGTNVCLYTATVIATNKLHEGGAGAYAELYSGLIMPPILFVFAEIVPKSLFQHHADTLTYRAAWPLWLASYVLWPFATVLRWMTSLPRLLLRVRGTPDRRALTREAVQFYLGLGAKQGVLSGFQQTVMDNILRLKSRDLGAVMTPLDRAAMLPADAGFSDLIELLRAYPFSRIPVYSGARENVVGVVHVLDLADQEQRESLPPVHDVMRLPRTASLADALLKMREAGRRLAVVTEAEGRAVGLVAMKDLAKEVVGEMGGVQW